MIVLVPLMQEMTPMIGLAGLNLPSFCHNEAREPPSRLLRCIACCA
jgi:hypothetical protein